MSRIRTFLYRSPRFAAECRMDFLHGDCVLIGVCSNVSESGLRGTFSGSVAAGTQGLLTLYYKEHKCELQAKVDSWREDEARVRFQFNSPGDRAALDGFLKLLAAG